MSHKKMKFWQGIRFKMTIGLCIVFLLSIFFLYWVIQIQVEANVEEQIISDMLVLKGNSEVYVRQMLMMENANNDEESFISLADEMVLELYQVNQYNLAAYSLQGEFQQGTLTEDELPLLVATDALLEDAAHVTIHYDRQNDCQVIFSMVVEIQNKPIGIFVYSIDYTSLMAQGMRMGTSALQVTIGIFVLTFIVLLLLLTGIIKPVQRLTETSGRIAHNMKHNPAESLNMKEYEQFHRKDEIGALFGNYKSMMDIIDEQFQKINTDRQRILELLHGRQEFYNNVTHELKTPLTTISGYAQLIQDNGQDDPELFQTGIEHILHESERLHQMVVQLLEMSNREIGMDKEPVDIGKVLHEVARTMELKANRYQNHIRCEHKGSGNMITMGYENKVRQLFINLIDNAIKYGKQGAEILILTECRDNWILTRFCNYGEGLSEKEMTHIFDPFYRKDKEYSREQGSSGLGLSICRKILEEMGGNIQVQSRPGKITVFQVAFPVKKEEEYD